MVGWNQGTQGTQVSHLFLLMALFCYYVSLLSLFLFHEQKKEVFLRPLRPYLGCFQPLLGF